MKRAIIASFAALILCLSPAAAASTFKPILTINGFAAGNDAMANIWSGTTYVSLRSLSTSLDKSSVITWENEPAVVSTDQMRLTARAGDQFVTINNAKINVPDGVKSINGRILIPLRTIAQAYGATVYWNAMTQQAAIVNRHTESYIHDDLYWLSRIISAESRGEPLEGKIAVGNVVTNRVKSSDFPDTIYGVIFDHRWGGQFEPVRNGTIYQTPTDESVLAAKLCLDGANVIGDSLYFLAPALAQNFWIVENREYVATIGCHDFYR